MSNRDAMTADAAATADNSQRPGTRIVVMGVSGCGKSSVGAGLAQRLGMRYIEGDQFHSPANLRKMSAGIALDDEDRRGWLLELQSQLRAAANAGESVVLTCSALKRGYRDLLREADPDLLFLHLIGSRELIAARMHMRTGHFMPTALLESQLRDLEPPAPDERAYGLSIDAPLEQLLDQAVKAIQSLR